MNDADSAITQVRVSDDYQPNNNQWSIGVSSLMASSLGLAPFKDTFWSYDGGVEAGNPYSADANETASELEAIVAIMSTGPVAPGDGIGLTDATDPTCSSHGR